MLAVSGTLVGCAVLLFLGGIVSAYLEGRREKRAGLPVSRPAWEARAARKAAGGYSGSVRGYVKGLRS